jgi:hypothetical protein
MSAWLEIHTVLSLKVDAREAYRLMHNYRDEELAKADLLPKADVVAWLVKKAREETPVWLLASKVDRGAVRPDNLRMLPADFFEPDRTYTEPDGSTDWRFRCDTVTTHPRTGERTAIGWRHFRGEWEPCAYGEDDWEIHQVADRINTTGEDGRS